MQNLKVALVQADLIWQNPQANREKFEALLGKMTSPVDLIVLPEMFTTGFTMEAATFAEAPDGPTVGWMQKTAHRLGAVLVGSIIVEEDGKYFNRFIWAEPQGRPGWYDKRHLFRMAGEHKVYSAGRDLRTFTLKGWKVRPFVCYDLRFPVWSRNVDLAYDVDLYVANWPQRRVSAWRSLLQARAAENQAYVIGVNRVGTDGLNIPYSGDSLAVDAVGNILADLGHTEKVVTVELDRAILERYREKFPAWKDADRFALLD